MNRLFMIDIRWVFLLGVFYLIWSRPQEPASTNFVAPLPVEPTVAVTPAPSGPMNIAASQGPAGGSGFGSNASYRSFQQPPFPSFGGVRKFADIQDDSQGDTLGDSLSGPTPVAGGVSGGYGSVIVDVYPSYRWGWWGYSGYYRGRFLNERVYEGRRFEPGHHSLALARNPVQSTSSSSSLVSHSSSSTGYQHTFVQPHNFVQPHQYIQPQNFNNYVQPHNYIQPHNYVQHTGGVTGVTHSTGGTVHSGATTGGSGFYHH